MRRCDHWGGKFDLAAPANGGCAFARSLAKILKNPGDTKIASTEDGGLMHAD